MIAPTGTSDAEAGVFYQCQRCGNCCRWPGEVWVDENEITAIVEYLGVERNDFIQRHTRVRANRTGLSLVEKPNGECFFLEGNACTINAVKPVQCRNFPNSWNFPGWRDVCEAIPVALPNA